METLVSAAEFVGPIAGLGSLWTIFRAVAVGLVTLPSYERLKVSSGKATDCWSVVADLKPKLIFWARSAILASLACFISWVCFKPFVDQRKPPLTPDQLPSAAGLGFLLLVFALGVFLAVVMWEKRLLEYRDAVAKFKIKALIP